MDVNEKDWKLFRKYLPDWQENYMETMKAAILTSEALHCRCHLICWE
ncbi:hypothetical protein SAMN02910276_00569 [Butyrivibrio sp. Su6]|nr:hypothetical protein [Butyrivibrio sp. Su6]SEF59781.1 hypothetical protein SAMN02910276_00569 [Butyrivibrio sp. Su6]